MKPPDIRTVSKKAVILLTSALVVGFVLLITLAPAFAQETVGTSVDYRDVPYIGSRTETYEEAVMRGEKIRAVWEQWQKHGNRDNFHIIGNEGGWDAKVDRVRQLIRSAIKS